MGLVKGEDVVLRFNLPESIVSEIYCARAVTIDVQRDLVETTITGSGNFRTYIPSAITWGGTIEGLVYANDVAIGLGTTSYSMLNSLINGATDIELDWYEEDMEHLNYVRKTGLIIIETVSETASFDNIATFNVTFKGNGQLTLSNGTV